MRSEVWIGVGEWEAASELREFDLRVHAAEDSHRGAIIVRPVAGEVPAERPELAAQQILCRYQRCHPRKNWSSRSEQFERVLTRHRGLHDLARPLQRAVFDHAVDAWQWVLELEPDAGLAVQLAALFHDLERLEPQSAERVEQDAPDYQYFKDRHAARGAELTHGALRDLRLPDRVLDAACALVASHERPLPNSDLELLNDADALSFFSLASWTFLRDDGVDHGRKKAAHSLARLSPGGRSRVDGLRLPPTVREWLSMV